MRQSTGKLSDGKSSGAKAVRCAIYARVVPFMQNNQPKFLTKDELRSAAMRELNVSKSAFDFGWMAAIEDTGRHDWYEPLRRRLLTKR